MIVAVLALAALATAYPYNPSYNPNGDSKSMQSSKDFTRRPSWQEYAAGLMQGKKPPPVPPTDEGVVVCVDGGSSNSLKKSQLEMILDTVHPITGNPIPFTNIITPDHGTNIYTNELTPFSAYRDMLEEIAETDTIWANYSPCPTCVQALLRHFNKPKVGKPTIHVARIYSESSNLTHIVKSFQCLAKLIYEGFAIVPWDFNKFKIRGDVPAFVDACISMIDAYYADGNFTSGYMELVSQVTFIQALGQNPHANSWCVP